MIKKVKILDLSINVLYPGPLLERCKRERGSSDEYVIVHQ